MAPQADAFILALKQAVRDAVAERLEPPLYLMFVAIKSGDVVVCRTDRRGGAITVVAESPEPVDPKPPWHVTIVDESGTNAALYVFDVQKGNGGKPQLRRLN